MSSTAPHPTDGTRVGRYTILREIASGGMATVFLARREDGGGARNVAIKRLHPHLATEEEFVTMFFDEARLAARIHHPNVVATLEVDDVEGLAIVMEYIEGPTLLDLAKDQSRRGAWLPRAVTSRIMLDVLAGLHAAHELRDEQGAPLHLVHRDVSPHNILVGVDGRARITDFGIAKAAVRLSSTRDGQMKGKLAYMAPELLTSDAIDRRADVFTAGIVLWELLTARRLFTGTSEARIMHALMSGEVPTARSVSPELPEAVDAVVMKALARDPAQRAWSEFLMMRRLGQEAGYVDAQPIGANESDTERKGLLSERSLRRRLRITPIAFEIGTSLFNVPKPGVLVLRRHLEDVGFGNTRRIVASTAAPKEYGQREHRVVHARRAVALPSLYVTLSPLVYACATGENIPSARGQRLTAESGFDSRLPFGGRVEPGRSERSGMACFEGFAAD